MNLIQHIGNGKLQHLAVDFDGDVPFRLSGGIGPEDASRILSFHHPRCVGIDLNSRFETEPGLKKALDILKRG